MNGDWKLVPPMKGASIGPRRILYFRSRKHIAVAAERGNKVRTGRTAKKIPIALPRSSNRYTSPITPAPTDKPGEAPKAWSTRQAISWVTDRVLATPNEPAARSGRNMR
jgi:hypothetical protein